MRPAVRGIPGNPSTRSVAYALASLRSASQSIPLCEGSNMRRRHLQTGAPGRPAALATEGRPLSSPPGPLPLRRSRGATPIRRRSARRFAKITVKTHNSEPRLASRNRKIN